jgi:CTD kinase subunit gamma CTK3 C-terminus
VETDSSQPAKTYFSQEEIKRRMEEDRERVFTVSTVLTQHKLLRESIWMIPQNAGPDAEFDMMWETTSSFGDDDVEYMHEENVKKALR